MPSRYRRRDKGAYQADLTLRKIATELRDARSAAGVSMRTLASLTGISRSQLARIERAEAPEVSVRQLSVLFAVLGMRLSARPYPDGPPLRDGGHARLLGRMQSRLPPIVTMRTEVKLRIDGDMRAWDAELDDGTDTVMVEAETVLYDLQAIDRRIGLKMADDRVDRVLLLVAATSSNRRVLREFAGLLAGRYPLSTRDVLRAFRAGRLPTCSGILIL